MIRYQKQLMLHQEYLIPQGSHLKPSIDNQIENRMHLGLIVNARFFANHDLSLMIHILEDHCTMLTRDRYWIMVLVFGWPTTQYI